MMLRLAFSKRGLCVLAALVAVLSIARAENRSEQHVIFELGIEEAHASIGLIHGWGFLSYENLTLARSNPNEWSDRKTPLMIDIVVSTLPEYDGRDWLHYEFAEGSPNNDREFWEIVGIGSPLGDSDEYNICCNQQAYENGSCSNPGRLIVSDTSEVKVQTFAMIVPGKAAIEGLGKWASSNRFDYTTHVVLVVANCNASIPENVETDDNFDFGGRVVVEGSLEWMSYTSLSSTPIKLVLALLHLGLFGWYRHEMTMNWQSRIQIEVWIRGVLALAAISAVVTFVYTSLEAILSSEVLWLRVCSDFLNKTRQVVSRCLYVAIALGLGVTKARLSLLSSGAIVVLGLMVLGSKETADVLGDISFARRDNNFRDDFNQNRHDFLKMQFKLNMLFYVWIPLALLWTMREMRTMEVEPQKLRRHRWLFCLYIFSWLVTSGMIFLYLAMRHAGRHGSLWTIVFGNTVDRNAVNEICNFAYWITLLVMAILWKPNPEAPMYGYVLLSENGEGMSEEQNNNNNNKSGEGTRNDVSSMEMAEFSFSPPPLPNNTTDDEEVHHDLSLQIVETVTESLE